MFEKIKCPICHLKKNSIYSEDDDYTSLICKNCKHIHVITHNQVDYTNLYNSNFYETYGVGGYKQDFNKYIDENLHKIEVIKKLIPKGGKVLEVGCGPGLFLDLLQKNDIECLGVELNFEAIDYGKSIGCNAEIITADISKHPNPITNKKYDIAIMFATIEHVEEPADFINLVTKYLKSGGYLIIDTGIRGALGEIMEDGRSEWLTPPYHLHVFSKSSMRILIERANLDIIYSNTKFNYNFKTEKNVTLFVKSLLKKLLYKLRLSTKNKNTFKGFYICQK